MVRNSIDSVAGNINSIGATFQALAGRFSEALANLRGLEQAMGRVNAAIVGATATATAVEDQVSGMGAALADAFGLAPAPVAEAPPAVREEVLAAFAAAGYPSLNGAPTAEAPAPTLAPVAEETAPVAEETVAEETTEAAVAEAVREAVREEEASARAEEETTVADRFPGLTCWADVRSLEKETVEALLAEVGLAPTGNAGKDRGALWGAVKALRGN